MASLEKIIPLARIHIRPVQFHLRDHWNLSMDCSSPVPMSLDLREHLVWWSTESNLRAGQPIHDLAPDHLLFSDASSQGWGAHLKDLQAQGLWTQEEGLMHINVLELRAVFLGLQAFLPVVRGSSVIAMTDNSTVVGYIKNQGGTRSRQLCEMTAEMLLWADNQGITLQSRHIPGRQNVRADRLSRAGVLLPGEWSLHPEVCKSLWKQWGHPLVDLFATRENARLQLFMSPDPDDLSIGTDALSQQWDGLAAYAYPPCPLIREILRKVESSARLDLILIAPNWPTQAWFPHLLELLVDRPFKLPQIPKLLRQDGKFHSNVRLLNLHAWRLSSDSSLSREFRRDQPHAGFQLSDSALGIVDGAAIFSQQLP